MEELSVRSAGMALGSLSARLGSLDGKKSRTVPLHRPSRAELRKRKIKSHPVWLWWGEGDGNL